MEDKIGSDKKSKPCKNLSMEEFLITYPELQMLSIKDKNIIIITKNAIESIQKHISWGTETVENVNEQGGILIGKPYIINGIYVSVVEYSIVAESTYANSAYLKMGHETWMKMLDTYDDLYRDNGYYVIGWYHTHPNSLPVFMSSVDRNTQNLYFKEAWQFAMVLNPHKQLIAFFNSFDCKNCDGYCDVDCLVI